MQPVLYLRLKRSTVKRHAGIINFFNNLFIRTGKISRTIFHISISKAFNIRMQSDYRDFYVATKQDAEKQIENAEKFLEMVKDYLSKLEN